MRVSLATPEFITWLAGVLALGAKVFPLEGEAYIKIIRDGELETKENPFAFIDRATGVIYRSANWRFPSKKTPRGNIFDPDNGLSQMTSEGPSMRKVGCPLGFKYDHKRKSPPPRPKKDKLSGEVRVLPPLISIPAGPVVKLTKPLPVRVTESANFWSPED